MKYFTARIAGPPEKNRRQDCYLDALKTLPDLTVIEGQYRTKDIRCRVCSAPFQVPTEKMTDVNLATELLTDAFRDQFDTAFVVVGGFRSSYPRSARSGSCSLESPSWSYSRPIVSLPR